MRATWRSTLTGANAGERTRIVEASEMAARSAIVAECDKRLAQHPFGLTDCSDIHVLHITWDWARFNGRVLFICRVTVAPSKEKYTYKWILKPTR